MGNKTNSTDGAGEKKICLRPEPSRRLTKIVLVGKKFSVFFLGRRTSGQTKLPKELFEIIFPYFYSV